MFCIVWHLFHQIVGFSSNCFVLFGNCCVLFGNCFVLCVIRKALFSNGIYRGGDIAFWFGWKFRCVKVEG